MKYIVVKTWNGEGLSYLNTAELMDFESEAEPGRRLLSEAKKEVDGCRLDEEFGQQGVLGIERNENWFCVQYNVRNDSGSVQAFPYRESVYGVEIICNFNEVLLHGEYGYIKAKSAAEEEAGEDDDGFYDCGDYFYQFIKL